MKYDVTDDGHDSHVKCGKARSDAQTPEELWKLVHFAIEMARIQRHARQVARLFGEPIDEWELVVKSREMAKVIVAREFKKAKAKGYITSKVNGLIYRQGDQRKQSQTPK